MIPRWAWAISIPIGTLILVCVFVALRMLWRHLVDYDRPLRVIVKLDRESADLLRKLQ
jgi:hypothetical protein